MRKMIAIVMVVLVTAALSMVPPDLSAESLETVFEAFRKIEIQMQAYTEADVFDRLVAEASQKVATLQAEGNAANCVFHLERALMAYEIINEIWQAQEHDSTVDAGWTCVPLDRYESWLESFPSLLTWQWGKSGVGVPTVGEAFFEPFRCCIILKPFLDDVWAPCLFHEAHQSINLAAKCFKRIN
ncbi:hypothetical protein ACFLZL_01635 [Thermodesulfobacteriota bacterium]